MSNIKKPRQGGARYDSKEWGTQTIFMTADELCKFFKSVTNKLNKPTKQINSLHNSEY